MDRKYDAKDYAQNPGKYRLFKTAQIACNVLTHNGAQDIPQGAHVAIEYHCEAFNALFRRKEPVYKVSGPAFKEPFRVLYANTLKNFVL